MPISDDSITLEKRQLRERLLKHSQQLKKEIEQLEVFAKTSRGAEQNDEDVNNILQILSKPTPSLNQLNEPEEDVPFSAFLSSFLPFAHRPPFPPSGPPISDEAPPSHYPIDVDDPLPYLQAFTPLSFTSKISVRPFAGQRQISMLNRPRGRTSLLQRHDIRVTSPHKLLNAHLVLDVDTSSSSVAKLSISSLSYWAEKELGVVVQRVAKKGDILAIGWMMSRYYDLSLKRARFIRKCQRKYTEFFSSHEEYGDPMDVDEGVSNMRQIVPVLGQKEICFSKQGVDFTISWKIEFDWTGEAESKVSASVSMPSSWKLVDERRSLQEIGPTFNRLVQASGAWEATGVILNLLFRA